MTAKSERKATRQAVAKYHEAQLAELITQVGSAIDSHRVGELDAFEVDQTILQYSRAAKELWKFCNLVDAEITADLIREGPPADWWERGAPRAR